MREIGISRGHRRSGRVWIGIGLCGWLGWMATPDAVRAHDDEPHEAAPVKVADEALYRPSPMPDRIMLTWKHDPASSQTVTWRTDATVKQGLAQIAPADHGPAFVEKAQSLPAETAFLETETGPAHYHTVNFTQLEPATKYAYRVGDGVNWTEWFQFSTASREPAPFSFVYFGDAQNDLRALWSRVVREAHSDAPKARFFLHAGDLVNHGNRDVEWGEWHHAGGWLNAMVPSVPTPGNHEYAGIKLSDGTSARRLSLHWRPQFALPENGPPGLEETAYWFDYQGVRIISLNSNELPREQVPWLEEVLTNNPATWTVVTFHHPVFSTARGRDNPILRKLWKPLFDKFRVDLVLQGHDHSYARTGLDVPENVATGLNTRSAAGGTVYVVSVSGPKMYDLDRREFMRRAAEDTQLYQIIHVNGDSLRYEARTALGELYDGFSLRKRPGEINELVEEVPATPERLRPDPPPAEKTAEKAGEEKPAEKPAEPAETAPPAQP